MLKFNLDDIARFAARIKLLNLSEADVAPLLENYERIMEEDNRKGVLAGTDKNGIAAPPLRYRPINARKMTLEDRLGQRPNLRRGKYAGLQPATGNMLANNNLTTSAYRKLDGPRLAPRKQFSRVITNVEISSLPDVTKRGAYVVILAWKDIVTPKGKHFLINHFTGRGQSLYDLRGVRPAGISKMRDSLRSWCMLTIRGKSLSELGGNR